MSTMLEAYDMPMLEYAHDIDIQMHPSSSDQWIPEESHMEEDTPAVHMKTENYSSLKPDDYLQMKADVYAQEKSEVAIEVDMELFSEHQNIEYEMQDEPALQQSITEAQDVEVYDISLAHSPFMIHPISVPQSPPSRFSSHFDHAESANHTIRTNPIVTPIPEPPLLQTHDLDIIPLGHILTSENVQSEINKVHEVLPEVYESDNVLSLSEVQEVEAQPEVHETHDVRPEAYSIHDTQPEIHEASDTLPENLEIHHVLPQSEPEDHTQSEPPGSSNVQENEVIPEETFSETHPYLLEETLDNQQEFAGSSELSSNFFETDAERAGTLHSEAELDAHDNEATDRDIQAKTNDHHSSQGSANDPHEISEGVYIDPPPPVLLSFSSEDQFDFSFFNESTDWTPSHSGAVLLRHLPTLYYEPLSAVFEALRQEEYLQSLFHLPESELLLDAVDLQLTISEDNVYAREVTLHDLNVLHDISGIDGLLRMRLYTSAPRFITRYQHLQEQVSRLNLEQPIFEAPSAGEQGEVRINQHAGIRQEQTEQDQESENQISDGVDTYHEAEHPSNTTDDREGRETYTDASHIVASSSRGLESSSSQVSQGNDEAGYHDETGNVEEESQAVEGHDPELYLPPLPVEFENEQGEPDETNDETTPTTQEDPIQPPSSDRFPDYTHASEAEQAIEEPTHENATVVNELGLPVEEGQPEASDEAHEEGYDYVEETHEIEQGDGHQEQSSAKHLYTEEDEEDGGSESRDVDGEYMGNAVNPEEEETLSHGTGDDLAYVQEEVDPTLETESFEAPVEDFEYDHPGEADHISDLSADLGSEEGQEVVYEDPGVDPGHGEDTNEVENGTEAPTELDNYVNLEDCSDFASGNAWESSIHHTGQETYDWEEDPGEGDDHNLLWNKQNENLTTNSSQSSVTLSSKASKRSFDELEVDDESEDYEGEHWSPHSSSGPKRSRIQ